MNNIKSREVKTRVEKEIKSEIKEMLSKMPDSWQLTFKKCFSYQDLEKDINEIVDSLKDEKIDNAYDLCERSLIKLNKS